MRHFATSFGSCDNTESGKDSVNEQKNKSVQKQQPALRQITTIDRESQNFFRRQQHPNAFRLPTSLGRTPEVQRTRGRHLKEDWQNELTHEQTVNQSTNRTTNRTKLKEGDHRKDRRDTPEGQSNTVKESTQTDREAKSNEQRLMTNDERRRTTNNERRTTNVERRTTTATAKRFHASHRSTVFTVSKRATLHSYTHTSNSFKWLKKPTEKALFSLPSLFHSNRPIGLLLYIKCTAVFRCRTSYVLCELTQAYENVRCGVRLEYPQRTRSWPPKFVRWKGEEGRRRAQ